MAISWWANSNCTSEVWMIFIYHTTGQITTLYSSPALRSRWRITPIKHQYTSYMGWKTHSVTRYGDGTWGYAIRTTCSPLILCHVACPVGAPGLGWYSPVTHIFPIAVRLDGDNMYAYVPRQAMWRMYGMARLSCMPYEYSLSVIDDSYATAAWASNGVDYYVVRPRCTRIYHG